MFGLYFGIRSLKLDLENNHFFVFDYVSNEDIPENIQFI
jgi:hypothetical protein